jgi:hypothetical protein
MKSIACATLVAAVVTTVAAVTVRGQSTGSGAETCTASDDALWQVGQKTLGIFVVDDDQNIGGAYGAKKFADSFWGDVGNKLLAGYYPTSGFKETACGQLDHWAMYRLGDQELDLHAHVHLDPIFTSFIDRVPSHSRGQPESACKGCLWGEVTVPSSFAWFWQATPTVDRYDFPEGSDVVCGRDSPLCAGQTNYFAGTFCMYGPWIMEAPHEFHVEIHPLQAFWGQQGDSTAVYVVDDDSDRFQRNGYFNWLFLSPAFKPWSGPLKATMFQVIRISPTSPSTLVWHDEKGAAGEGPAQNLTIPSVALTVKAPTNVSASVVRSCHVGGSDQMQVLLRTPLPTDSNRNWRGLNVSGTNTGISYTGAKVTSQTFPSSPNETTEWHIRTSVSWNDTYPSIRSHLLENQRQWGNLSSSTRWSVVGSQDALFSAIGDTPDNVTDHLQSSWDIKLTNLDDPSKPVTGSDVRITLDYDRNIPTETPTLVERHPRAQAKVFVVGVRFPIEAMTSDLYAVPNVRVDITANLSDQKRHESYHLVLYSIVPNFLASVSGYDLKREHGAFPNRLSQMIPSWLTDQGCTDVTLQAFQSYLDGFDDHSRPLPPLLARAISARTRSAGVVRQTVNYLLADGTMTADEFIEFEGVMAHFLEVCLATM